ncbi:MAG TPA: TIGR02646 family protein [Candidatus Anammoximicrobium sp.]|nr:TIGR02646 family protein [Candidatus Anammoximicrobium sp.]
MRKQTRPPVPAILQKNGERWTRQWVELRGKNPIAAFQWYQADGMSARTWLLPHLKDMTQGHCAFCDCFPLDDRSKEPIEHFKPKSDARFYAEAYSWQNLYYCCDCCQSSKRERWDDRLLRPDADDYSFTKYFVFDYTTGEIRANSRASVEDQSRAETTIALYGLDLSEKRLARRLELRKWQRSVDRRLDEWAYRDYLDTASRPSPPSQTVQEQPA